MINKIWNKLLVKVIYLTVKNFFSFTTAHENLIKMGYILIFQIRHDNYFLELQFLYSNILNIQTFLF